FAKAQPLLKIFPEQIEFKNKSDRIENVYFINSGNEPLTIDTIVYNLGYYFIRFNVEWSYPQVLQPGDTVQMDCILGDYAVITRSDTADTMSIYNDQSQLLGQIKIKIDYFDDEYLQGTIKGRVTNSAGPVNRARVYFIYSGNYIIHSEFTDEDGGYSANLPPGYYLVAVQKDSYYVSFYQGQFDPFDANRIFLRNQSTMTADFLLQKMINTGNSLSGTARDLISNSVLKRGTIVARSGRHTPNKVSSQKTDLPHDIYVSFINYNGNYTINNIIDPGYYYVQTFSDYYIPAYYSQSGYPSFWQQADSLFVNGNVENINFFLQRDSSVGSGMISGRILNNPGTDTLTDITVLAQSLDYDHIFNYSFGWEDTSYEMRNLPYGRYKLIGEKLGFENATTEEVTIDSANPVHTSVDLIFKLAGSANEPSVPEKVFLYQNYPNPFNPSTNIKFYLPEASDIKLYVTNILGEEAALLYNGFLGRGEHQTVFNADGLSSGIYFMRLVTPKSLQVRKILLLK
ncbi:MAG TPA: carboxypeptidase regulatory-like domain-containing protein, partial [Ignavibacteriaceae bacterium]|nr:carboxypeptidase regulatory-like domain-containing protein [Ignavibacteriaceae bacterium]